MLAKLDTLLEEVIVATVASAIVATGVAVIYWLITGLSPWPELVLGLIGGFGVGIGGLALASPRRRR